MNQMKQKLEFEGDLSHLQHNFIQFLVIESAFIPNSLSDLTIIVYPNFSTIEPPFLRLFFNVIAQIV